MFCSSFNYRIRCCSQPHVWPTGSPFGPSCDAAAVQCNWTASDLQVAVALGTAVYLWNAGTGVIEELCATTEEDDYITSLAWAADGAPQLLL